MTIVGSDLRPKGITRAHLIAANIGQDYWQADFSNYKGPINAKNEAFLYLQHLKEYKEGGIGLLFAGKVGVGKTTLLAVVLKYLAKANWTAYMTSLSELLEAIKRSWDTKDTSEIDRCKQVTFLGIDDLGKEHAGPTGFSAVTFDNLIRYRVQHRLPTLLTTNLDRKEIKSRYGDATLSLIEGKTRIITVNGFDYRTKTLKHEIRKPV